MIIQIANPPRNSVGWKYTTQGHYCVCDGADQNGYHIVDPYYYPRYAEIENGDTEGYFYANSELLAAVIKKWGEKNSNVAYTSY